MRVVSLGQIPKVSELEAVPLDEPIKVYKVCKQMEMVCELQRGIGLSAVQVGIPWSLFIIKFDESSKIGKPGEYGYFVNCEYTGITTEDTTEDRIVSLEGCLSIRSPDGQLRLFRVERFKKSRITGLRMMEPDLHFEKFDLIIDSENQGVVMQHEIDHHLGILISDIGKEVDIW